MHCQEPEALETCEQVLESSFLELASLELQPALQETLGIQHKGYGKAPWKLSPV